MVFPFALQDLHVFFSPEIYMDISCNITRAKKNKCCKNIASWKVLEVCNTENIPIMKVKFC